uniref:Uncharacterized protein n=1 Tax=Anguilla anguilla TaxID=7936 RepID=A0A0E9V4W4_ANGAN
MDPLISVVKMLLKPVLSSDIGTYSFTAQFTVA